MYIFRLIVLITSLISTITTLSAQEPIILGQPPKPTLKDHLFYGGSFGLQVGSSTLIDISPLIGYKITPKIGIGVSTTYRYYAVKNYFNTDYYLKTNVFGGSIFGRAIIYQNFFAHAEYEYLTWKNKKSAGTTLPATMNFQSVLVGAGYREPISENAFMYLLVLWNLNETIDSPYTNPVIRAGVSIGF